MKAINKSVVLVFVVAFGLSTTPAYSERYSQEMKLLGPAEPTKISGFTGSTFIVGVPDGETDEYALYGVASEERRDHPCYVTISTENINDSKQKLDLKKDLCGGTVTSKEIKVEYKDSDYGRRAFISGVRVCMNNKGTRVKGLQLRGKQIMDDGKVAAVAYDPPSKDSSASLGYPLFTIPSGTAADPNEPRDIRNNCEDWKKWVECPNGQIATAAILHFEAGKQPRSLTGIALQCRRVSLPGTRMIIR